MRSKYLSVFIVVQVIFSSYSPADQETDAAISEVQGMMQSPDFAKKASKNSPEGTKAAEYVKQISGDAQNEQEMYKLAAEVLGNMKGLSLDQMKEVAEKAKVDPEAFAKTWTPEQLKKLKQLSERMPAANQKKP
ncbi:MAG: hypothetical protein IPM97_06320 [Bdellovibrionaceae bacterium]|nr:hypothetical protein [Pseudobdellovibrionaceae bacterium]